MKNARLTLDDMNNLAAKYGGKCLSKEYINAHTKLKWKCSKGHIWEAEPRSIKNNSSWCLICSGSEKYTLEKIQELAGRRGGKCLSKKYVNAHTKLIWQCANGHIWETTPNSVRIGNWCPVCGFQNILENFCREIFRSIFDKDFPKLKPNWLINSEGRRMELDGYNKELGLAFEYHGKQHFSLSKFFHDNSKDILLKRKRDDLRKRKLCKQQGIKLIEISYKIPVLHLYSFIVEECNKFGVRIPPHKEIDVSNLRASFSIKTLIELEQLAEKRGGKLFSTTYLGNHSKLQWQCRNGHQWEAEPASIKLGTWCPLCARKLLGNKLRGDIQELREIAAKHDGRCLSKEYTNVDTPLIWQCAEGHTWKARPYSIKAGTWCPVCGHKSGGEKLKNNIAQMQNLAHSRNGECLSKEYVNARTKIVWKCERGHIWKATPDHIKRGQWCPICAGKKPT